MNLIEVKTSELIGAALDWAVAKCVGERAFIRSGGMICDGESVIMASCGVKVWAPSTDWSQGGPLIEKNTSTVTHAAYDAGWWAHSGNHIGEGKTPLIAVCRAIVAAKLGDLVSVPSDLVSK